MARALAVEPTVLLLDEPFGALDAKVRKELREWLRRLHDEVHVTTVFVTHDQEEAMEVADEIVVINNGRVEQVGSPDQLYDEPASDFVMGFVGEVTRLGPVRLRPHDIEVAVTPGRAGALPGTVTRYLRVGFEVRLQVELDQEFGALSAPSRCPRWSPSDPAGPGDLRGSGDDRLRSALERFGVPAEAFGDPAGSGEAHQRSRELLDGVVRRLPAGRLRQALVTGAANEPQP